MTAQIEREPREGVELAERWTWRDYAAMALSYALIAALAWALVCGDLVPVVCLLLATTLLLILTNHDTPRAVAAKD
ncbi:hypothetical protein [Lysobacter sp. Root667]|uniref:hypothetical protein n=1 Tax=Lysobacter sp. Root667 TaxID=1736581 RepID=UPI0009E6DE7C|nr:hypothetical protein [Lysobacter sp. Root667]